MLLRTHLAFAFLIIIMFVQQVSNKFIFVLFVIIGTILPDLDSGFSSWGRHLIFRPLQFFTRHRGVIHSFTFAVIISIILALFFPVASLGFFVGFSVHLVCDSFTKEGIQPFWPSKMKSSGVIRSGSRFEDLVFVILILVDVLLFLLYLIF